jgi:glycosyltransferase involved in cell wall biosynthesis
MKTCESLAKAGAEVELVVPKSPSSEDPFVYYHVSRTFTVTYTSAGLRVGSSFRFAFSMIWFSELAKLSRAFWKAEYIYSRDALILLQYILLRRRLVYEAHTEPTGISRFVARRAYRVVTITHGLKDAYVAAGVSADKVVVAPDGIELADFEHPISREAARKKLGLPDNKKIILYLGRLDGWKGVRTLFEAAALLPESYLVTIAGGEPEQVRECAARYPRVRFLGFTPYREVADNQQAADVLVLPNTGTDVVSVKYTSPLKLFTYMASGIPMVASDLPSIREVVDERSAILVTPDDPGALAAGIVAALTGGDDARARAARARELVSGYTWKARAQRVLSSLAV